jgi:hypothetical protein
MAIIKYKEVFIGMQNVVYEIVEDPNKKGKVISKNEAMRLIKEQGLVKVHKSEDGTIWDYPNEPFLEKYKGVAIKDL